MDNCIVGTAEKTKGPLFSNVQLRSAIVVMKIENNTGPVEVTFVVARLDFISKDRL